MALSANGDGRASPFRSPTLRSAALARVVLFQSLPTYRGLVLGASQNNLAEFLNSRRSNTVPRQLGFIFRILYLEWTTRPCEPGADQTSEMMIGFLVRNVQLHPGFYSLQIPPYSNLFSILRRKQSERKMLLLLP